MGLEICGGRDSYVINVMETICPIPNVAPRLIARDAAEIPDSRPF